MPFPKSNCNIVEATPTVLLCSRRSFSITLLDLLFAYSREGMSITGQPVVTPELNAASGASIWEYRPIRPLWTPPESVVRVVGVQSSYMHSKCFLAKSWLATLRLLEEVNDTEVTKAVRSKLLEEQQS